MRMPNEGEDLVGKVCICSLGRMAVVTALANFHWGEGGSVSVLTEKVYGRRGYVASL